jgi:hypothetical protein
MPINDLVTESNKSNEEAVIKNNKTGHILTPEEISLLASLIYNTGMLLKKNIGETMNTKLKTVTVSSIL